MLSNHSSIRETFSLQVEKWEKLYRKRAFVHWFADVSAVEGDMIESNEVMKHLVGDYEELTGDDFNENSEYEY